MFGSSKRHTFKPTAYGASRRPRRIPRWLVLMLTGVVLGAGGLLFLQKSYGPTRLTVQESEQLHYDLNSANLDKQRLQTELNRETHELTEARAQLQAQATELENTRNQLEQAHKDIQMFASAMPPDPRGTSPGIRAASFRSDQTDLNYDFLVMQDEGKTSLFKGTVELVMAGRYNNGRSGNIDIPAFDLELERYTQVSGAFPLPGGFTPTQVTIKIKRQGSEKVVGTRTIRVIR